MGLEEPGALFALKGPAVATRWPRAGGSRPDFPSSFGGVVGTGFGFSGFAPRLPSGPSGRVASRRLDKSLRNFQPKPQQPASSGTPTVPRSCMVMVFPACGPVGTLRVLRAEGSCDVETWRHRQQEKGPGIELTGPVLPRGFQIGLTFGLAFPFGGLGTLSACHGSTVLLRHIRTESEGTPTDKVDFLPGIGTAEAPRSRAKPNGKPCPARLGALRVAGEAFEASLYWTLAGVTHLVSPRLCQVAFRPSKRDPSAAV